MVPQSFGVAFLPQACLAGKTDSGVSETSVGVLRKQYVAVRKEPLNHALQFCFQRITRGIMVPRSFGVAFLPQACLAGKKDSGVSGTSVGGLRKQYDTLKNTQI